MDHHSPFPWRLKGNKVVDANGHDVALMLDYCGQRTPHEVAANADVILKASAEVVITEDVP